jgi:hypothetical protein
LKNGQNCKIERGGGVEKMDLVLEKVKNKKYIKK